MGATYREHIESWKQRASQLYCCRSLHTSQDLSLMYKSWIRPALEYGSILYAGATSTHLQRLDCLQSRIEQTCSSHFQSLLHHRNASIIGQVCRLLAGEGQGSLQNYCPLFRGAENTHRQSTRLHAWDPAAHCALLIQLISGPSIGFDVVGRLWRSTFGILFRQTYS